MLFLSNVSLLQCCIRSNSLYKSSYHIDCWTWISNIKALPSISTEKQTSKSIDQLFAQIHKPTSQYNVYLIFRHKTLQWSTQFSLLYISSQPLSLFLSLKFCLSTYHSQTPSLLFLHSLPLSLSLETFVCEYILSKSEWEIEWDIDRDI